MAPPEEGGRMGRAEDARARGNDARVDGNEQRAHKSAGRGMVRTGDGIGIRAFVRILVHGFSSGTTRDGRAFDERGAKNSSDCSAAENVFSIARHSARTNRDWIAECGFANRYVSAGHNCRANCGGKKVPPYSFTRRAGAWNNSTED